MAADTSQVRFYYKEESTWASVASGTYNELRITGESLSEAKDTVETSEISSDRQLRDTQQTSISAEGDVEFELSFETFDDLIEGALLNRFDGALNISGSDISADGTNNNFDSTSTDFSSVAEGQWINVGGFSNSENNGFFRVDSGSTNTLSVRNQSLTDESSGSTITIDGNRLRDGTTDIFFTFEKELGDVGDYYRYPGVYISSMDLDFSAGELITGTFSVMSEQEEHNESQTPSTISNAPSKKITNATNNIKEFREGGSTSNVIPLSLSLSYDNNLRERPAIGQATTQEFGTGTINLTGSVEFYFEDDNLYQKYLNFDDTDISFRVEDDDGNVYIFTIPNMKYSDGSSEASAQNEDVFQELDFTSISPRSDGIGDAQFQIDKFPA